MLEDSDANVQGVAAAMKSDVVVTDDLKQIVLILINGVSRFVFSIAEKFLGFIDCH